MNWTTTEWVLYGIGMLVAVASLTRLMRTRRDQLVHEVETQLAEARQRKRKQQKHQQAA